MSEQAAERKPVAILAADIASYSRLAPNITPEGRKTAMVCAALLGHRLDRVGGRRAEAAERR